VSEIAIQKTFIADLLEDEVIAFYHSWTNVVAGAATDVNHNYYIYASLIEL
jgi:hypothetical protein